MSVLACFSLFYAFVVPFLPDGKTGHSNPLQALWWAVPGAIFFGAIAVIGYRSLRKRTGRFLVWNDDSLWIEYANIVEWELRWGDFSHFKLRKGLFGKLMIVDILGNERNVSSMSAVDASSLPILVQILRIMANDPSQIPAPEVRKKMPKWQVVLYGIGVAVSGTIGLQQLLSFQTNVRSESPEPFSVIQVLVITACTLLFAFWSVLFVSGLGSQRSGNSVPTKPFIPKWRLEDYLAYGALPSPSKEVRFRVPSATSAKQYLSFAKATLITSAIFFAGIGAAAISVGFQPTGNTNTCDYSTLVIALMALPFLVISALIVAYQIKDRAVVRQYDDVLTFEEDKLFVQRQDRRISVANWKEKIKRVRVVLELEIEGQRTHYDLSLWKQDVWSRDGE